MRVFNQRSAETKTRVGRFHFTKVSVMFKISANSSVPAVFALEFEPYINHVQWVFWTASKMSLNNTFLFLQRVDETISNKSSQNYGV